MKLERRGSWCVAWLAIAVVVGAIGCANETPLPEPIASEPDGGADVVEDASEQPEVVIGGGGRCLPVHALELEPARLVVMSTTVAPHDKTVFVQDVFSLFKSNCGGCHVDGNQGNPPFQVTTTQAFAAQVDQTVLDRLMTENPDLIMPPRAQGGRLASERTAQDPVSELATLLQAWIAAGRPADVFYLADDQSDMGASPYLMTAEVGENLTNIGNCIPEKEVFATEHTKSAALDAYFATLTKAPPGAGTTLDERIGLPTSLDQTDLVTFDSEQLSHQGIVAYAPAYPLWSDNARKLRHVRVPRGQSIVFHKDTQTFDIPPNTRFYKTFMKRIIDTDGSVRYRKIETRLIVARPDIVHDDGSVEQAALFGSYSWNDDETVAELVTDPLRDLEPFRDRLITYITDEPGAKAIREKKPPPKNLTTSYQKGGVTRHYAIPGSARCQQCHMGSPTRDFVLGFTPLQVNRRPLGEGGIIEAAGDDELTQLQRLIDYGVVTGVDSTADILPLEKSQGPDRPPRNDYELRAQGYMVGNCAHCHNPHGYPSVANPVLVDKLNFLPGSAGGIFQFPLDRTSPRIERGSGGDIPMPYITPSLVDYPFVNDPVSPSAGGNDAAYFIAAPWRSLIYRNVDTPFTYTPFGNLVYGVDTALLPHMPLNVPGYDCRAPRIMGDWMVSIPAVRVHPELLEDSVPDPNSSTPTQNVDTSVQPYLEVKSTDDGYDDAKRQAETRLLTYHDGKPIYEVQNGGPPLLVNGYSRYAFCPDTSDIVDPAVSTPGDAAITRGGETVMPVDGVPDRPQWVVTDITEVPGPWAPRRTDWEDILINHHYPPIPTADQDAAYQIKSMINVVQMLGTIPISKKLYDYATTPLNFGIWKEKAGCDWNGAGVQTVGSLAGAQQPLWVSQARPPWPADAHVYQELPGAAVFNMICINCHGEKADSLGRQADTLMTMTGGDARVADLRDGLFGPVDDPGANRRRVFGPEADLLGITVDNMAARYLAFMGLGGTAAYIPPAIMSVVIDTPVLGTSRKLQPDLGNHKGSANMLAMAKALCRAVLPVHSYDSPYLVTLRPGSPGVLAPVAGELPLISTNGDAELWRRLCAMDNRRLVLGLQGNESQPDMTSLAAFFFDAQNYPPGAPVGSGFDAVSVVDGITDDNPVPWCLLRPYAGQVTDPAQEAKNQEFEQYVQQHPIGNPPRIAPFCPDELFAPSGRYYDYELKLATDLEQWIDRGAINAGFSVFLYLDKVLHGYKPVPPYDQCDRLSPQ